MARKKRTLDTVYICDTREQRPFFVDNPELETKVRKLHWGDYTIEGIERIAIVERKSGPDFIQSFTNSRERFERELLALRGYKYSCVVVECSYSDIVNGLYRNNVQPKALVGSVARWTSEGVPFHFCGNRDNAEQFTKMYLDFAARNIVQYLNSYAPSFAVAQAAGLTQVDRK